ncbi:MAG: hypothetical protein EBY09_21390 [Verrucomicrobia bacterium]|nr:hypothetical protein [Verrucomicrobiota bacterium]NDD40897.1 hypothetical protein [Verrucomicrobiota bacterium]NDF01608.1 hypothetical protein [Verrucomicrobiota bacterium]
MNTKDLIALGVPPGEATRRGLEFIANFILKGGDKLKLSAEVALIVRAPGGFTWRHTECDEVFGVHLFRPAR